MKFSRVLGGYLAGLGAAAAITFVIGLVAGGSPVANVSILYLPAVLLTAVRFGRGPAIAASVAAFLLFDWFFVEPRYHFTVADPEGWIALLLLLLTGAVTGQLAADQRRRAQEAEEREREAVVLYDVSRLMSEPELERALHAVADRLRSELGVRGISIELEDDDRSGPRIVAGDIEALEVLRRAKDVRVLGAGRAPTADERGGTGRWLRLVRPQITLPPREGAGEAHAVPVTASGRRVGTIFLLRQHVRPAFSVSDNRLLAAAAAQLGIAVERARLRHEAAEAELLRRTDDLRSALLNAVSHDLRTPLASILASASSLQQSDVTWSEAEREEFLAAIEEQARRLDRLVGNLLDLSRIEAGALRPERAWYDAGALVDDVLGRLRGVTSERRLTVTVDAELPPVPLDYVEIDQVLSNLVENAVKFSPAGSEIEVSLQRVDGAVRFAVRDHGPGIVPRDEPLVFAPFRRLAAPDGHSAAGVGLGLTVAKRLVEAHGGRLWLERPQDGGVRFVFTLPLDGAG